MKYTFDNEPTLGKAVIQMRPFCKLTKKMDVPQEKDIVGDFADPAKYPGLAGRKWSKLCGFTFKANNGEIFQFVYVPKLKGSFSRNQMALSGWYCWTLPSNDINNKQVTSINDVRRRFNFDINKFVHSDVFDKYVKLFKDNVQYAIQNQIEELLSHPKDDFEDYRDLVRYVNAVKESIAKINDVKAFVTVDNASNDDMKPDYAKGSSPKVGHANIAYNADKTYDLRNDTQASQKKELRKRAISMIANKLSKNAAQKTKSQEEPQDRKQYIKFDSKIKDNFNSAKSTKSDDEIFDKYDYYDNDDFR